MDEDELIPPSGSEPPLDPDFRERVGGRANQIRHKRIRRLGLIGLSVLVFGVGSAIAVATSSSQVPSEVVVATDDPTMSSTEAPTVSTTTSVSTSSSVTVEHPDTTSSTTVGTVPGRETTTSTEPEVDTTTQSEELRPCRQATFQTGGDSLQVDLEVRSSGGQLTGSAEVTNQGEGPVTLYLATGALLYAVDASGLVVSSPGVIVTSVNPVVIEAGQSKAVGIVPPNRSCSGGGLVAGYIAVVNGIRGDQHIESASALTPAG